MEATWERRSAMEALVMALNSRPPVWLTMLTKRRSARLSGEMMLNAMSSAEWT